MPAFDLATRIDVGRDGAHPLDDRQQLVRAVAAVAADRVGAQAASAATACSGETPIIVWPRVSNVIVAMIGIPAETWRTPRIAAPISDRCDIVSIQITSTPPAISAAACSAKTSTASSSDERPERRHDLAGRPDVAGDERPPTGRVDLGPEEDRRRPVQLGDPVLEAVQPEPQPVAAERVRHDDPRAGLEIAALDPPDDLGLADVPDLGRIAELEPRREQHRAHRPVGEDRAALGQQGAPARVGRTGLGPVAASTTGPSDDAPAAAASAASAAREPAAGGRRERRRAPRSEPSPSQRLIER